MNLGLHTTSLTALTGNGVLIGLQVIVIVVSVLIIGM